MTSPPSESSENPPPDDEKPPPPPPPVEPIRAYTGVLKGELGRQNIIVKLKKHAKSMNKTNNLFLRIGLNAF